MLKALFGSEPRVKILNLLLLHPDTKYSLRQLSQNLNLPSLALRREIENLQKSQLISFVDEREEKKEAVDEEENKKENNQPKKPASRLKIRLFAINQNFILYPEIRALFIKAQILSSQKFIIGLQKIGHLKLLLMTGLFTNDTQAPTDILIVGHIKHSAFLKLINELEKDLGREINFTILSENEFNYRQEMMDIFLFNILGGKTLILLNELGLKP